LWAISELPQRRSFVVVAPSATFRRLGVASGR
jgi:hypothetical protein